MRRFIMDRRWRTWAKMKGVSWSCRSYLDVCWLGLMGAGRLLPSWRSLMQVRVFFGAATARDSFETLNDEWFLLLIFSFFFYVLTQEHDITWGYLLTMEKEDLQKVEAGHAANCLSVSSSSPCQISARSQSGGGGQWCCGSFMAQNEGSQRLKW